jgi:antibiotic biosynthesis monooxygenase (ABM) superfamily enzyme
VTVTSIDCSSGLSQAKLARYGRMVICRLWRGWTTPENADAYEAVVRGEVIPGIEARGIPGFRSIDLMRREAGGEVEFATLMWFDDLDAIRAFMGDDYEVAHVPERARAVLSRFDERSAHFEVLDRCDQPPF